MAVPLYPIPGFNDPISSLTHLLGACVFAVLAPFLLWRGRGNALRVAALAVFAFSVVFLLAVSGIYHLLALGGVARAVLLRFDHGAIFLLIAGTFTPLHIILLRGTRRWAPLLFVWVAALSGILLRSVFFTSMADWMGMIFYLALGWVGLLSGLFVWQRRGFAFISPLVGGGIAYTIGGMLDSLNWPVFIPGVFGPHECFHVAVLLGVSLHWLFVSRFASDEISDRETSPKHPSGGEMCIEPVPSPCGDAAV